MKFDALTEYGAFLDQHEGCDWVRVCQSISIYTTPHTIHLLVSNMEVSLESYIFITQGAHLSKCFMGGHPITKGTSWVLVENKK